MSNRILQSIYSMKWQAKNAPDFEALLARARSDIFFNLLMGQTIVAPAEAFFDSSAAVRCFGELFAVFDAEFCALHGWRPLHLVVEGRSYSGSISSLVAKRWSTPPEKQFLLLFRADDPNIDKPTSLSARLKAGASLNDEDFDGISTAFDDLQKNYRFPLLRDQGIIDSSLQVAPILSGSVGAHFQRIFKYLQRLNAVTHLPEDLFQIHIAGFSLKKAIETRASDSELRNDLEFQEMVSEFIGRTRTEFVPMGKFAELGLEVFRHHYDDVRTWVERDWHIERVAALTNARFTHPSLSVSTDFLSPTHFEFPQAGARVFYADDIRIKDIGSVNDDTFFDLPWEALEAVIRSDKWRPALRRIRDAKDETETQDNVSSLIELLARILTDFSFEHEKGRLRITGKAIERHAGEVGAALGVLTTPLVKRHFGAAWDMQLSDIAAGVSAGIAVGRVIVAPRAVSFFRKREKSRFRRQLHAGIVDKRHLRLEKSSLD